MKIITLNGFSVVRHWFKWYTVDVFGRKLNRLEISQLTTEQEQE